MKKGFFRSMFSDESGEISSKRILGTICVLALVIALLTKMQPNEHLISAVEYLGISLFFATSSDKAMKFLSEWKSKKKNDGEE